MGSLDSGALTSKKSLLKKKTGKGSEALSQALLMAAALAAAEHAGANEAAAAAATEAAAQDAIADEQIVVDEAAQAEADAQAAAQAEADAQAEAAELAAQSDAEVVTDQELDALMQSDDAVLLADASASGAAAPASGAATSGGLFSGAFGLAEAGVVALGVGAVALGASSMGGGDDDNNVVSTPAAAAAPAATDPIIPGTDSSDDLTGYANSTEDLMIDAGAGDDTITTGTGNDIVRPNEGTDTVSTGAGDDVVVVVGRTNPGQYQQNDIDNPAGDYSVPSVSRVLVLEDTVDHTADGAPNNDAVGLNDHTISDITGAEVIDGGEGNNILLIYGDVVIPEEATLDKIKVIQVNSTLTVSAAKLSGITGLTAIKGDGESVLVIKEAAAATTLNLTGIDLSNFAVLDIGKNVTVIADQADIADLTLIKGTGSVQPPEDGSSGETLDLSDVTLAPGVDVNNSQGVDDATNGGSTVEGNLFLGTPDGETINTTTGPNATNSDVVVDAKAGDDTVITGAGDDTVRPGAGADTVVTGAGNDDIVVVGLTESNQYSPDFVSQSLALGSINGLTVSEVVTGDTLDTVDGGAGSEDTLHILGDLDSATDLTPLTTNVENIRVHDGVLTLTTDQVNALNGRTDSVSLSGVESGADSVSLSGVESGADSVSSLRITQGADTSIAHLDNINLDGFTGLEISGGVKVIASQDNVEAFDFITGTGTIQAADGDIHGDNKDGMLPPNIISGRENNTDGKRDYSSVKLGANVKVLDEAGVAMPNKGGAAIMGVDVDGGPIQAIGTNFDDTLDQSSATDDVLFDANAGNDSITTGSGDDFITPGEGMDTVSTGGGSDTIYLEGETFESTTNNPHTISDVVAGETIDGGASIDTLSIIGHMDLTGATLEGIERIDGTDSTNLDATNASDYFTNLTIDAEQLDTLNLTGLDGGGNTILKIERSGTDPVTVDLSGITDLQGFGGIDVAAGVTVLAHTAFIEELQYFKGAGIIESADDSFELKDKYVSSDLTFQDFGGALHSSTERGNISFEASTSIEDIIREGTVDGELIETGSGDDNITALGGDDAIWTGYGDDTIDAGEGDDEIRSGAGNDTVNAGDGVNHIWTSFGDDTVTSGNGVDNIWTGDGNDIVKDSGDGDDNIWTGDGNDEVHSGEGDDEIETGDGNDIVDAGNGEDDIDAGAGNDTVDAGDGDDTIDAGEGIDTINAGAGNDTIYVTGKTFYSWGDHDPDQNFSDIVAGEVIDGGTGTNKLMIEGYADLSGATVSNINNINVTASSDVNAEYLGDQYTTLTITAAQFNTIGLTDELRGSGGDVMLQIKGAGTVDLSHVDDLSGITGLDVVDAGLTVLANNNLVYREWVDHVVEPAHHDDATGDWIPKVELVPGYFVPNGGNWVGSDLNIILGDGTIQFANDGDPDNVGDFGTFEGTVSSSLTILNEAGKASTIGDPLVTIFDHSHDSAALTLTTTDPLADPLADPQIQYDIIETGAGNDKVTIASNNDFHSITTGVGNDTVTLNAGADAFIDIDDNDPFIHTGEGNDTVTLNAVNVMYADGSSVGEVDDNDVYRVELDTGAGDDTVTLEAGGGAYTGDGNDTVTLKAGGGVYTGDGNDIVTLKAGGTAHTEGGNDLVRAGAGIDTIHAGDGADIITVVGDVEGSVLKDTGYYDQATINALTQRSNLLLSADLKDYVDADVSGDTYDGEDGADWLVAFGKVDLTNANVDNTSVRFFDDLTVNLDQIYNIGTKQPDGITGIDGYDGHYSTLHIKYDGDPLSIDANDFDIYHLHELDLGLEPTLTVVNHDAWIA